MLKKFRLEDSKPTKTPMSTEIKLTKDDEADFVDSSKYRGMIGSLLYLITSRPDIMFSVCLCARFQENPKTTHLEAVKRIFRYIRGTSHLGLWYLKGNRIETIVYADSDHVGDYVDRKSTSGVCIFMGCCLTSWFAKKQTALAISTTEAEYVSAGKACQQALWMKQALIDYGIRLDDVPIMCDNKGTIDLMDKNHPKSLNSRSDFHHNQNQNESSITFSPRSDPLHHDSPLNFLTLPSRMIREFEIIMSVYDFLLCEISISRSQENVHANPSSIIESLPVSPIPIEDSELVQEEIDIFLVPDDLIPPGVENDDSEDEDNELPNLDHQDNPSSPRPLPEPPNVCYI
ncbi:hypothetical protein Tco_0970304 [Tanacetum coccineum]